MKNPEFIEYNNEVYVIKETYDKDVMRVQEEIEILNNIINRAIEYLESYNTDFKNCRFGEAPISLRELGDLLDILKGVELTENDKKQVKWLKEEFKVGVDKE